MGRREMNTEIYWGTSEKDFHLEDLDVDGKTLPKLILKEQNGMYWVNLTPIWESTRLL
jgi:hypothetical protein